MIDKTTYWNKLNGLIDDIVEAEDRPTYSLEMDIMHLPVLASLALAGDFSLYLEDYPSGSVSLCLSDMHFMARSGYMLPKYLSKAPLWRIKFYVRKNRERILTDILSVFLDYYNEYYK